MKRFIRRLFKLALVSSLLASGAYLGTDAFGRNWRDFVIAQMAERGLHLDFKRLVLNPFGGIVAREVQIFATADRCQVLAAVDRLNLDFDFGRLLEKSIVLEGLELSHANVSLPVDPDAEKPTVIELQDISARAFLHKGRLELRHAEGTLYGIQISITGDLELPPQKPVNNDMVGPQKPTALERMQGLQDHQQRIQRGLEWLKRFQFASAPRISLEVHGALHRLADMNARLYFDAEELSYEGYACRELRAEAEYDAGMVDLTRLHLKDSLGEVNASATWRMGTENLRFHLTSSADLPGMAQTFLNNDNLREVVFYEPPHLALDGVWHVDGPQAGSKRPVQVTGRLDCGRFSSRGAVFDGLAANIGVAPEGVYIRDLLLRHEAGTLSAQVLVHQAQGCRYRVVLRMDPNVFLPFAKMKQTREIIQRFQFRPESSIHLEITGTGPEADPQKCLTQGHGILRNFAYRGVDMELVEADLEFQDTMQHYRNLRIQRQEGSGTAEHVQVDDAAKWVRLEGIRTKLDAVAVTSCFAPKTADIIARYRLPTTTAVELDGIIYYRAPEKNDFQVKFRHAEGTGRYQLWGEDYLIKSPSGDLAFKGHQLSFDIKGSLFGGALSAIGSTSLSPGADSFTAAVRAEKFPYLAFGRKVPFENLTVHAGSKGVEANFDVKARLLGGGFSLKGMLNKSTPAKSYSGELRVDNVSLPRFAQTYSMNNDTEGDITGHFKFTGKLGDWSALKGGGAAIILNGNLYSVPVLGPLTPLLGAVLPAQIKGYNIAREANCTFEVTDGYVMTQDFEALTSTFRILLSGRIDFIRDALDLAAQVRVRGLPGIVFLPFSELLQFQAEGSIADPKWEPRILKAVSPEREKMREPPSAADVREAERIAGKPPKPVIPEPKRPAPSMFNRPGGR